jgi:L-ectoine synthase
VSIQIIQKSALEGTSRHVRNDVYETFRFLLATDAVGVTVTDIVLNPGVEETYGYDDHIEIAYCIEGRAALTDLADNTNTDIVPGVMWVARKGQKFRFIAYEPTRLICMFTPPFEGHETGLVSG